MMFTNNFPIMTIPLFYCLNGLHLLLTVFQLVAICLTKLLRGCFAKLRWLQ